MGPNFWGGGERSELNQYVFLHKALDSPKGSQHSVHEEFKEQVVRRQDGYVQ